MVQIAALRWYAPQNDHWEKGMNFLQNKILHNPAATVGVLLAAVALILLLISAVVSGKNKDRYRIAAVITYALAIVCLLIISKESETRVVRFVALFETVNRNITKHTFELLIYFLELTLFIPFGYLLRRATAQLAAVKRLLILAGFSLAIELVQYAAAKGTLCGEDLVLYVAGGFLGMLLCGLLHPDIFTPKQKDKVLVEK